MVYSSNAWYQKMKGSGVCFAIACFVFLLANSQDSHARQTEVIYSSRADSLFDISEAHISRRNYTRAKNYLEAILALPKNQRSSSAHFILSKIALDEKNYTEASDLIERFFEEFPKSRFTSEVRMLQAETYFEKNIPVLALQTLISVIAETTNNDLRARAVEKFINIFDPQLTEHFYAELKKEYTDNGVRELLDLKVAQLAISKSEFDRGFEVLGSVRNSFRLSSIAHAISEMNSIIEEELGAERSVVVLTPFSGEGSEEGARIFKGAQVALKEYNASFGTNIKLKPVNSKNDPAQIPKILKKIADDPTVISVIGPMNYEEQIIASSLAPVYQIPIVIPNYNDDIKPAKNDYTLLPLASSESEGESLAKFAVEQLGHSTFAILSPIGGPEQTLANSFALEIERLGGEVLVHEWYYPGTLDFEDQFSTIRKIGYDLMMTDSLRVYLTRTLFDSSRAEIDSSGVAGSDSSSINISDTLNSIVEPDSLTLLQDSLATIRKDSLFQIFIDSLSIAELDSVWMLYQDSLEARRKAEGIRRIDSLDFPVHTFDAILIPLSSKEDINILANQFAFYNFQTTLLGNHYWYQTEILERLSRNFDRLYFTSDNFLDDSFEPWANFRNQFRNEVGQTPGINELYGYNAMKFVLNSVRSGAVTRNKFWETVTGSKEITDTASGELHINDNNQRENWIILEYLRNRLQKFVPEPDRN